MQREGCYVCWFGSFYYPGFFYFVPSTTNVNFLTVHAFDWESNFRRHQRLLCLSSQTHVFPYHHPYIFYVMFFWKMSRWRAWENKAIKILGPYSITFRQGVWHRHTYTTDKKVYSASIEWILKRFAVKFRQLLLLLLLLFYFLKTSIIYVNLRI